jgi:hypothetical protein
MCCPCSRTPGKYKQLLKQGHDYCENYFRPVYIQEFAAQCFAFVARKVRDKDGLIRAILEKLDQDEDVRLESDCVWCDINFVAIILGCCWKWNFVVRDFVRPRRLLSF